MFWVVAEVLHHRKSMGQLWDAPAPRGATLPHFEVWSYRACQPLQMCKFHIFVKSTLWAMRRQVFAMLSLCVFFVPLFRPWGEHRTPIAYKSHSTPFPIRPHVLTPHSWLCDKNCGRSSAPIVWSGRIVITILECIFPEENVNGACSGKTRRWTDTSD